MKTLELTSFATKITKNFKDFNISICTENNQSWFDITSQFHDTEGSDEETALMQDIREELDIDIPTLMRRVSKETEIKVLEVIDCTKDSPSYYYKTNHNHDDDFDIELTMWFNGIREKGQSYIKDGEIIEAE